jgi:4-amino-4-deoxy-L-arabinose transferase-like glycosyltransferase
VECPSIAGSRIREPAALRVLNNVHAPLDRKLTWLAFLGPLVLLSIRLGGAPLFDVDEGAFSEATREMFERHDFLSTYLNGAHRFDKPILIYWLQAASVSIFGFNEFGFRFPSVVAAAVWCQAVAVFGAPRIGARNALFGCGIAATSLGVFVIGRAATADSLLNALLALALFDAWRAVEQIVRYGDLGRQVARPALRRAYLWIALGVLTKGPVAILIPVATVFLYALAAPRVDPRFTMKDAIRLFFDPVGWAIFVVVAAPWYVAALMIHGRDFVDGFLLRHNVERFTSTLQGHSGSALYYVLMVPLLLWPWLAWLVSALGSLARSLRSRQVEPLPAFLWIWCVFVIAFFSLSGTKLPHYALYGCTPLFLLCAIERERVGNLLLAALPVALLIAFVCALPDLLEHAAHAGWIKDAFYRAMALRAEDALPSWYRVVVGIGAAGALAVLAWPRRRRGARPIVEPERRARRVATRVFEAALIATILLDVAGAPYFGDVLQGPVERAALVARGRPEPAVTWNFHMPSFAVYRERVTPIGTPAPGELALTRVDRLPADVPVERLFEEGGVVLVRRR